MAASFALTNNERFGLEAYFRVLTRILGSPGRFYNEFPEQIGFRFPFGFLILSSLFYAGASLTCIHERPVIMAGIFLANAVAMTFILAGIGYMVMTMSIGKRVTFSRLFAVYAFASGVTLLASWIPLFQWFTEPWKWVLIGIGMFKGCGFKRRESILIIGVSIFIVVLFFWSLAPVMTYLSGLF